MNARETVTATAGTSGSGLRVLAGNGARSVAIGILVTVHCSLLSLPATAADRDATPLLQPDTGALEPSAAALIIDAQDTFERRRQQLTKEALGDAYGRLGMVYQAWQFQEAARSAYVNAVRLAAKQARWQYYLAVYYEEVGEFSLALDYYRSSLKLMPTYTGGWIRLGEVAVEAGRLDEAESAFRRASVLDPQSAAAIAGLGTVAMRRELYKEAVERFLKAIEVQPEASQLHYRLAQAYRHLGDLEKARIHLDQRGDRIASSPDPLIELMKMRTNSSSHYVETGKKAFRAGNHRRAMTAFRLALDMDPDNVDAYFAAAQLYFILDQLSQADALLDRATELDPDHEGARQLHGQIDRTR